MSVRGSMYLRRRRGGKKRAACQSRKGGCARSHFLIFVWFRRQSVSADRCCDWVIIFVCLKGYFLIFSSLMALFYEIKKNRRREGRCV
jgi:hypothetical protein